MRLVELRLRNFRCYKDELVVGFDDLTTIVGRNDVGKSTILDALHLCLNDEAPDKHDACKNGNPKDLGIMLVFGDLPDEVVLDEDATTSFAGEYLLAADGHLVIEKVYNGALEKPKVTEIRIHARHPSTDKAGDLLRLTNTELKARAREVGVDLQSVLQTSNSSLRKGIRQKLGDLQVVDRVVSLGDGTGSSNSTKVWKGIQAVLPAFALFKSDRASTDQDAEAQDPLKAAMREAIKHKERELEAITEHVLSEVRKIADLTLEKLREMDPALASTLTPTVEVPKWHTLFKASINSDNDVPINKRGSGVRRLVLLNFFRAKAEQMLRERVTTSIIYAIEEPETSQHPRNQRLLMSALQQLSGEQQVIITTHTPMLARAVPDRCIRYLEHAEDGRTIEVGGSPDTNARIAKSLGVLPDHNIKLFIAIEGPTDINFLRNLSNALIADGVQVPDLENLELDGHVMFVPLGGSTVGLWSFRLKGLDRPEFHLYDRDHEPPLPPKYHAAMAAVNTRNGCRAVATNRREIESYVHHEAINESLRDRGIPLTIGAPFAGFDDVPNVLAGQVNPHVQQGNKWGDRRAKEFLCSDAVKRMTKARLDDIDPDGEVIGWFTTMQEMIASNDD